MHRLLGILVASVLVIGFAACGDDDDGGGFGALGDGGQQGTAQPGVPAPGGEVPPAGGGAAYTQAQHDDFANECANFPGASPELCECAWTNITQTVPYADYQAFETAFASGSTDLPAWLTSAVATCS